MTMSQRQINTLVELVDVELRDLDSDLGSSQGGPRVPLLGSCKQQLLILGATERAYRKKSFPDLAARVSLEHQAADAAPPPPPAAIPPKLIR